MFQVDVTGHEIRAVVGKEDRVLSTRRVGDEVGGANERKQVAARSTHGEFAHCPVAGEGDDPFAELIEVRVSLLPSAGPLRVQRSLRIGGVQFRSSEASLNRLNASRVPENIFRGVFLR